MVLPPSLGLPEPHLLVNRVHHVKVSLPYAAPEVVSRARSSNAPGYGPAVDLWSLGVIFHCMLSGKAPFQPSSRKEPITALMDRIRTGAFTMDDSTCSRVDYYKWKCPSIRKRKKMRDR
ncbi:hypothetical protein evm_014729 [Chilo suppressalis]|nr:hypothetical protein evm_014729 [Chilo suppressalis]